MMNRAVALLALGLAACGYDSNGCQLGDEITGAEGRSVFSVSNGLPVQASWSLAAGDRFLVTTRSLTDAPPLTPRSSQPAVLSVGKQHARSRDCSVACEDGKEHDNAVDRWTIETHAEGDAELTVTDSEGVLYDRVSLKVAKVERLDLVPGFSLTRGGELPIAHTITLDEPGKISVLWAQALDDDGGLVAVACGPRVSVEKPELVEVSSVLEKHTIGCAASDDGIPASSFVLEGLAPGETRITVTLGSIQRTYTVTVGGG